MAQQKRRAKNKIGKGHNFTLGRRIICVHFGCADSLGGVCAETFVR